MEERRPKRSISEVYQPPAPDVDGSPEVVRSSEVEQPPEVEERPEVEQTKAKKPKIKRKYIYVSAHSYLPPAPNYIRPVDGVKFANLVAPDILCYNMRNQFVLEPLVDFSNLNEEERERDLRSFLHKMRFVSTTEHLREPESEPYLSSRATEQTFSIRKEKATVLGIFDLDDIRARPFIVFEPSILGEPLPDTDVEMTTEQLRNFLMERFPDEELVILLAGCRVTLTPERKKKMAGVSGTGRQDVARSFEPKTGDTTAGQLAERVALGLNLGGAKKKKKNKKTARSKPHKKRNTVKKKKGKKGKNTKTKRKAKK